MNIQMTKRFSEMAFIAVSSCDIRMCYPCTSYRAVRHSSLGIILSIFQYAKRYKNIIFFMARQPLAGLGLRIVQVPRLHPDTPHSVGLLQRETSPSQWPPPDSTQHSQEKDIHVPGGIRTHSPNKWGAANARHSSRGHWDRFIKRMVALKLKRSYKN
jgi:hypothetical protein